MEKAHIRRALHVAAAVIVALLAIGLYKAKSDAARTEAHVRRLQAQIEDSEADLRALRAQIAERESPGRVAAMAEEHLGLVVGSGAAALPEEAMARRLPPPEQTRTGGH